MIRYPLRLLPVLLMWSFLLRQAISEEIEPVFPAKQWATKTPAEVGMDDAALNKAREYALSGGGSGYIIRHGYLVLKWGDEKKRYDLKSTTKSFGATALGVAILDGKMALNDPAVKHHPGFGVPPDSSRETGWLERITLQHLATQTAGFEKPGGYTRLAFEPGAKWAYSDGGPNWLAECITLAYRRDVADLMFERVFTPIGIAKDDLTWRNNSYRAKEIDGLPRREFGSGTSANVDAMARVGYLYLREGRWNGKRILPAEFVRSAGTTVRGVVGVPVVNPKEYGKASDHYGLLWWNNADGTLPNVPRDAFWSWGLYDSLIVVVPSLDIVVARAGQSWNRTEGEDHYGVLGPFLEPIATSVRQPSQAPSPPAPLPRGEGSFKRDVQQGSNVQERSGPQREGETPVVRGSPDPAPRADRRSPRDLRRPSVARVERSGDRSTTTSAMPIPQSPVFAGIEWAASSQIVRRAKGSDNWPITWGDDDHLYTAYGDGRGFEPFVPKKLSLGLAKIAGSAPDFRGVNLRSPTAESLGDGARGRKASGILMVDGVLYLLVRNAGNAQLGWSRDRGATWSWADWKFTTSFGCPTFLNFGRNYAGARDRFVYIYSHDSDSAYQRADRMVLARVDKDYVTERDKYEFFVRLGDDGRPSWSPEIKERGGVLENRGRCFRSSVSFNAAQKRYLWCQTGAGGDPRFRGGLTICDAPEPWGPWTVVFATDEWDVGPGETSSLPTKWISDDGLTLHLVFSGDDSFSVCQGRLLLHSK